MANPELATMVKEALSHCADETGWANLAKIGAFLRKQNVKYGKLSRFFQDYQDLVETRVDSSITPPAVYAKLKEN